MLGKTAGSLYWMFRYLERCENTARIVEAGFYIALTRGRSASDELASIMRSAGVEAKYLETHQTVDGAKVIDFMLRDRDNPVSVRSVIDRARSNARTARTALTREVWEAVNEAWMVVTGALKTPVGDADVPALLGEIKRQTALVRGALEGTMLRNDIFDFCQLGLHVERADATARILDVKYHVLLPSVSRVGGSLDNVQWETILRCVSAQRSYGWVTREAPGARDIADFLILNTAMPRSLAFCQARIAYALISLNDAYGTTHESTRHCARIRERLVPGSIDAIFKSGLHEFISDFLARNQALGSRIEQDYRFFA